MRVNPIQQNFAAGELSPRLLHRTDLEAYRAGLYEMYNMHPYSQGPATRRKGSLWRYSFYVDYLDGRLIPWRLDESRYAIIVMTHVTSPSLTNYIYIYRGSSGSMAQTFTGVGVGQYQDYYREVQYAISPDNTRMYIFHWGMQTRYVDYDPVADTFSQGIVTWNGQHGPDWRPGCGFFYEGRLWVGGFARRPAAGSPKENDFFFSKSGLYEDFTLPTGSPTAGDAHKFTMANNCIIHWMAGLRQLMIGTDVGEFVAESSDGDVIWAGNIKVRQQSQHGSDRKQPLLIGNNILFTGPRGGKVRDTGYRWTEDAWVARDLTYVSEHMTGNNRNITHMAWAPDEDNLIYAINEDGSLMMAVYEWNNNVIGWSRGGTAGTYIDVCSVVQNGLSKNFFLSLREANGEPQLVLEQSHSDMDQFLDAARKKTNLGGATTVTGLLSFAGQTVQVYTASDDQFTNPAWHPDRTVDASGNITLQREADHVIVGHAFMSRMVTMPLDMMASTGSMTSTKKRRHKIGVRLINSTIPIINGQPPKDRSPSTPMGEPEPPRTQDVEVTNLGHDKWAQVTIEQDHNKPLTVAGIYGDAALGNL